MAALIGVLIAPTASITYVLGAVLSAAAGYVGMTVATMANARTTQAAKDGPGKALSIAFRGGAVMGFSVAGLALGGLMLVYILFVLVIGVDDAIEVSVGDWPVGHRDGDIKSRYGNGGGSHSLRGNSCQVVCYVAAQVRGLHGDAVQSGATRGNSQCALVL